MMFCLALQFLDSAIQTLNHLNAESCANAEPFCYFDVITQFADLLLPGFSASSKENGFFH